MAKLPATIFGPKLPNMAVEFDIEAFDNLTRNQGVLLTHWRAMRCPIGMTDMYDDRQNHGTHSCSNGFIYSMAGKVTCQFVSNSDNDRQVDAGLIDGSTVQCSAPRYYDDKETEPVHIVPFDRFYLDDETITVVNWQLAQHNLSGIDKMRYPVVMVELLIDNQGIEYKQGIDFNVSNGVIVWTGKRPAFDLEAEKGGVYTVRYRYRPYYIVSALQHEVRLVRNRALDGEQTVERTGQAFSLQREHIFENAQNNSPGPTDLRAMNAPGDITFGPR